MSPTSRPTWLWLGRRLLDAAARPRRHDLVPCLAYLARLRPPTARRARPRLTVTDDLRRLRLTVLVRFPLALPHLVRFAGSGRSSPGLLLPQLGWDARCRPVASTAGASAACASSVVVHRRRLGAPLDRVPLGLVRLLPCPRQDSPGAPRCGRLGLGSAAQGLASLHVLTDRYPHANPLAVGPSPSAWEDTLD